MFNLLFFDLTSRKNYTAGFLPFTLEQFYV